VKVVAGTSMVRGGDGTGVGCLWDGGRGETEAITS